MPLRPVVSAVSVALAALALAACASYPGAPSALGASVRLGLAVAPTPGYAVQSAGTPFEGYAAKDVSRIVLTVKEVTANTAIPVQVPGPTAGTTQDLTFELQNQGSNFVNANVTFSHLAPKSRFRIEAVAWGVDADGRAIEIQADDGTCMVEVSTAESASAPGTYEQAITADVNGNPLVIPVKLRTREFSGRVTSPAGVTIVPGTRTPVDFTTN